MRTQRLRERKVIPRVTHSEQSSQNLDSAHLRKYNLCQKNLMKDVHLLGEKGFVLLDGRNQYNIVEQFSSSENKKSFEKKEKLSG